MPPGGRIRTVRLCQCRARRGVRVAGEILRSWAVPKGPSLDPGVRRLAIPVEDRSLTAGGYEGVRAGQARGAGAVIIWDEGDAEVIHDEPGHLSLLLHGSKLAGGFALTRTGERRWILVKTRDNHATRFGHRGRAAKERAQRHGVGRPGKRVTQSRAPQITLRALLAADEYADVPD